MVATSRIAADVAYVRPKAVLRNGSSGASAPWFMSTTRWPSARRPSTRVFGRLRVTTAPAAGKVSVSSGARHSAGGGRVTKPSYTLASGPDGRDTPSSGRARAPALR